MDTFIERGTRTVVEVGSKQRPRLVRWTTWGNRVDIQQSFILRTSEGAVLVDPVQPIGKGAWDSVKRFTGEPILAVVCTSPFHERDADLFRDHLKIPVFGPKLTPPRSRLRQRSDELYDDGDMLPGGIQAIWSGDKLGEMWLYWKANRSKVLICADTIYGQTQRGGFDGATVSYWLQEGGIRLRMNGKVDLSEMRERYGRLQSYELDLVMNGHNPRPIQNPIDALKKVLTRGELEVHPKGVLRFCGRV